MSKTTTFNIRTTNNMAVVAQDQMQCVIEVDQQLQKLREEVKKCEDVVAIGDVDAYWYQKYSARAFAHLLESGHKRVALLLPTGAGKTNAAGLIYIDPAIRSLLEVQPGEPMNVLFCSHRHQLLRQAEDAYESLTGVNIRTQSTMSPMDESVVKWAHLIVLDEAHHETTMSFQSHLEKLSDAVILGLSAGLDRLDNRLCKFSAFIEPISRQQAVEEGYLAESYIRTFCGAATPENVEMVIDRYADEMGQTMIFFRTKKECRDLVDRLNLKGIDCAYAVDITEDQLNEMLVDFANKKFQFLVSCMKLGEGIDVKGCSGVILGRNVISRSLLNQMIGRGARRDSDCNVYEFVTLTNSNNLTAVDIIGLPKRHTLHYKVSDVWSEREIYY